MALVGVAVLARRYCPHIVPNAVYESVSVGRKLVSREKAVFLGNASLVNQTMMSTASCGTLRDPWSMRATRHETMRTNFVSRLKEPIGLNRDASKIAYACAT